MTTAGIDTGPGHSGGASNARQRPGDRLAWVANATGHFAAALMLLLTIGIVLDIVLRWFRIENSWAYNLSLYAMAWMAFTGAAFTAIRGQHVTAGIALENMVGNATILGIIRVVVVCGFLILLAIAGNHQAHDSLLAHKTTLDLSQWPEWVGEASVPVGAVLWIIAAVAVYLRRGSAEDTAAKEISAPI